MRTLEELPLQWQQPEALHWGAPNSEQVPGPPACSACTTSGAPGPTSGLVGVGGGTGELATAGPNAPSGTTPPAVRGRAGADAGRSSAADGQGGGPSPDSCVRMAAEGSWPYLDSPTLEARHVPQASAQQTPLLGGRSPDLPPDQDGCASLPTAQIIPLQVDMAMAQERGKRAEKCSNSYLCLLPTVFTAGRYPPARTARWPRLLPSWLARSSPLPLPP